MKQTPLLLTLSLALALSACGGTEKDGIDRRAQLETIQSDLNSALGGSGGSYGNYLRELSAKSNSLMTLAALPTETASGDNQLTIRNLVVSISSGALLTDLPGAADATKTAIRNSFMSEGRLKAACETVETADCALGQTLLNTMPSREIASDALALSAAESVDAGAVVRTYQTFAGSLPVKIPTFSMEEPDAGATTHFATMRQQACTLSWAHSLALPKIAPDDVMSVNAAFRSAMADAFDQTKVNLCAGGPTSCTPAELKCASGEDRTSSCLGKKTSALLSSCGPVGADLAGVVLSLTSDDQTGT